MTRRYLIAAAAAALTFVLAVGATAADRRVATVTATITGSGQVAAARQMSLDFAASGTLVDVDVEPGQRVRKGEALARVDDTKARQDLRSALASLASAQAALAQLSARPASWERDEADANAERDRLSVAAAEQSLADTLAQARHDERSRELSLDHARAQERAEAEELAADEAALARERRELDAARAALAAAEADVGKADEELTSLEESRHARQVTQTKLQNEQAVLGDRLALEQEALQEAESELAAAKSDEQKFCGSSGPDCTDARGNRERAQARRDSARSTVTETREDLANVKAKLAALAVDLLEVDSRLAKAKDRHGELAAERSEREADAKTAENAVAARESEVAGDKAKLRSAAESVEKAVQELAATRAKSEQSRHGAQSSLDSARATAAANRAAAEGKEARPTESELAAAKATLAQAEANAANARDALEQTVLRAPADGTVAAVNGEVGDAVGGGADGSAFLTLVDVNALEVDVEFDEADAAALSAGQPATVTVPALDNAVLTARVVTVGALPAETEGAESGEPQPTAYAVRLALTSDHEDLRPGMTAEVAVTATEVLTTRKESE